MPDDRLDHTPTGPNDVVALRGVYLNIQGGNNGWMSALRGYVDSDGSHTANTNNTLTGVEGRSVVRGDGESGRGANIQCYSYGSRVSRRTSGVALELNCGSEDFIGERGCLAMGVTMGTGIGEARDFAAVVQAKPDVPPLRKGYWVDQNAVAEAAFLSPGFQVDPFGNLLAQTLTLTRPAVINGSWSEPGLRRILQTVVNALNRAGIAIDRTAP